MSRNNNTKLVKKPYCKVCQDAGKPESVYTSHWVKSLATSNGKSSITCPTLLDTECRYCFKLGHTTKFCPTISQSNKQKEKEVRRNQVEINRENLVKVNIKNVSHNKSSVFAALDLGSDSEEERASEEHASEEKVSSKEEFPTLHTKNVNKSTELTGWAAIAAKTKTDTETVFGYPIIISNTILKPKLERQVAVTFDNTTKTAPWAKKDIVVKKPWADYSESESEGEQGWNTYEEEEELW
jgi:hypothetical protein